MGLLVRSGEAVDPVKLRCPECGEKNMRRFTLVLCVSSAITSATIWIALSAGKPWAIRDRPLEYDAIQVLEGSLLLHHVRPDYDSELWGRIPAVRPGIDVAAAHSGVKTA